MDQIQLDELDTHECSEGKDFNRSHAGETYVTDGNESDQFRPYQVVIYYESGVFYLLYENQSDNMSVLPFPRCPYCHKGSYEVRKLKT